MISRPEKTPQKALQSDTDSHQSTNSATRPDSQGKLEVSKASCSHHGVKVPHSAGDLLTQKRIRLAGSEQLRITPETGENKTETPQAKPKAASVNPLPQKTDQECLQELIRAIDSLSIECTERGHWLAEQAKDEIKTVLNLGKKLDKPLPSIKALLEHIVLFPQRACNISVIKKLADAGYGLSETQEFHEQLTIPLSLMAKLLKNSGLFGPSSIIYRNFPQFFFHDDPLAMEIVEEHLNQREIKQQLRSTLLSSCEQFDYLIYVHPCSTLPERTTGFLLPALIERLKGCTGIYFEEKTFSRERTLSELPKLLGHGEFLLLTSLLEVCARSHAELTRQHLGKLFEQLREILVLAALVLGQAQLYEQLTRFADKDRTLALSCGGTGRSDGNNLLHILADSLLDVKKYGVLAFQQCFSWFQPDYRSAWGGLPIKDMANQRDKNGQFPLERFYRHHTWCLASRSLFDSDENLIQGRRDLLVKNTSPKNLALCMKALLQSDIPKNVNWFREFLVLHKGSHGHWDKNTPLCTEISNEKLLNQVAFPPAPAQAIQAVVDIFRKDPDTLSSPEKVVRLLQSIQNHRLPVEYRATVLSLLPVGQQKTVVSILMSRPEWREEAFIEREYKTFYTGKRFYPWHLIALGLHGHLAPVQSSDEQNSLSAALMDAVSCYQRSTPKHSVPVLPQVFMGKLDALTSTGSAGSAVIYGRSLAIPSDNGKDYLRFKFLKKQYEVEECWEDFIREQPHLVFFRDQKPSLGLESALLKPKGVYRLDNAAEQLRRWNMPESFLDMIALEKDGSAFLQVFEDEPDTRLYHKYTYDISGDEGLSVQASFNGIGMFGRDAGRLWRREVQAPDSISCLHDSISGRVWNPVPAFGGMGIPGTLGDWNAQNYPNISPEPVGMRDAADFRAFKEFTFTSFGMRRGCFMLNDSGQPERYGQFRIVNLGNNFYGQIINWLRVRHDVRALDYLNEEHIVSLEQELVTMAAGLCSLAYGLTPEQMRAAINSRFPESALRRAAMECAYWCDPDSRYVKDIREERFPDKVYPDHPTRDLDRGQLKYSRRYLSDKGITPFTNMKGVNLGIASGSFPLAHIDSLFWFCVLEGWLMIE